MKSREELVEDLLDEKEPEELVQLSEMAKDPKVVSIRTQWKDRQWMSDKQRAVLARWIADEALEYGDPEEE